MTRHTAIRKPPVKVTGEWLRISHEMTWAADSISGRDDLVVTISPDAGYDDTAYDGNGSLIAGAPKHPGITFIDRGIVEVDADYLPAGMPLESVRPSYPPNRRRYPVVWGILVHESAHAHYSRWTVNTGELDGEQVKWLGAALLLEESRVEHKHLTFRSHDREWLQAMAAKIATDEAAAKMSAAENDGIPREVLARLAALILARIDAGSVAETSDTYMIRDEVIRCFGRKTYRQMQQVWLEAQQAADTDTTAMLALGKRWLELTGDSGETSEGTAGKPGDSAVEHAMARLARDAADAASGHSKQSREQAAAYQRETEMRAKARETAAASGKHVPLCVTGHRDPVPSEISLARKTKRLIEAAYFPDRTVTKTGSIMPPGKLRTRSAMQLDAQHHMGVIPDAEPFRRKERRRVQVPPLKVAIIQDVSGSQHDAAAAAVSGAWSLAKATSMIRDAQVAMFTFGSAVDVVMKPSSRYPKVPVIRAGGGTRFFPEALFAAEGTLDFTCKGYAKLVVVLTDGVLSFQDMALRDSAMKRLTDMGVKFLWMKTDGYDDKNTVPQATRNVHVFTGASGNYDVIPQKICVEAVSALKTLVFRDDLAGEHFRKKIFRLPHSLIFDNLLTARLIQRTSTADLSVHLPHHISGAEHRIPVGQHVTVIIMDNAPFHVHQRTRTPGDNVKEHTLHILQFRNLHRPRVIVGDIRLEPCDDLRDTLRGKIIFQCDVLQGPSGRVFLVDHLVAERQVFTHTLPGT